MCVQVAGRLAGIEERYQEVVELSRLRRQALQDALALYRLRSEAGSCEAWIEEKEQWLSSMEIPERLEDLEVVQHRSVPEEPVRGGLSESLLTVREHEVKVVRTHSD